VSKYDFYPQPEVESGIIRLKFNPKYTNHPNLLPFIQFLAGIFPYKNKILKKALGFLQKKVMDFHLLRTLSDLDFDIVLAEEMKNKRLWMLKPVEIWELFSQLMSA
jgi:16S rRNA A1518/A1519 N6-dimethyltransferase RsmA/KsgA/DIM1 with predicted DNA glycosylase/AP lyase activity